MECSINLFGMILIEKENTISIKIVTREVMSGTKAIIVP
jgi:hypothetical protein